MLGDHQDKTPYWEEDSTPSFHLCFLIAFDNHGFEEIMKIYC